MDMGVLLGKFLLHTKESKFRNIKYNERNCSKKIALTSSKGFSLSLCQLNLIKHEKILIENSNKCISNQLQLKYQGQACLYQMKFKKRAKKTYSPTISRSSREGQAANAAERDALSILSILYKCNFLRRVLQK